MIGSPLQFIAVAHRHTDYSLRDLHLLDIVFAGVSNNYLEFWGQLCRRSATAAGCISYLKIAFGAGTYLEFGIGRSRHLHSSTGHYHTSRLEATVNYCCMNLSGEYLMTSPRYTPVRFQSTVCSRHLESIYLPTAVIVETGKCQVTKSYLTGVGIMAVGRWVCAGRSDPNY